MFDVCYHCGQSGHYPYQCHQRREEIQRGKRPAKNYSKEQLEEEEEETAFIAALSANLQDADIWYIDLGASQHMMSRKDWFKSIKTYSSKLVELGDKYPLSIKGVGTIVVNL